MRRALVLIAVMIAVAACGLSITGTGTALLSESSEAGVAPVADAGIPDVVADTGPVDAGCQPEGTLICCGGAVCPSGTAACTSGRCTATLSVTASIDGTDNLVLQGSMVWWFHVSNDDPTSTKLNGAAYNPSFPDNGLPDNGCDCDAKTKAALSPPAAAHVQNAVIAQTNGRGTVTLVDAGSAQNGYELSVQFRDPPSGADNYAATIQYETR